MDWLSAAQVFVLSQGLLLCVVILSVNGDNPVASRILALFVGLTTIGITLHLLVRTEIPSYRPVYVIYILMIMKGPLLYLYVRSLTEKQFAFSHKLMIHILCLLPALICWLWFTSGPYSIASLNDSPVGMEHRISIFYLLNSIIIFSYSISALRLLKSHRKRLERTFSALGPITLNWLKWLIIYIIATRLLFIMMELAGIISLLNSQPELFLILDFGVIYFIAIGGLKQPQIFNGITRQILDDVEKPENTAASTEKYQRSAIPSSRVETVWKQLLTLFDQQNTYMQEDLNLSQLAKLLHVTPHELSQVINVQSEGNFYELVNRYRINKARELLKAPDNRHRKLLDIAMEVGYKSQSTFYSQFNRHAGMTPKKYRDEHSPRSAS